MKYFSMIGRVDQEMLERFIEFYNHGHEQVTIIINSQGGGFFYAEAITMMINSMKDVTLVLQGVFSAGFYIAFLSKCKKVLSLYTRGMWHYGKWDISTSDNGKPYFPEDECILKNLKNGVKHSEDIARKSMTDKEYKRFKNNEEVYFDLKRMKQIFPEAAVI